MVDGNARGGTIVRVATRPRRPRPWRSCPPPPRSTACRLRRWRPLAAAAMAATVVAMVASAGAWATGYAPPITRLAGPDRYATSAAVAATYGAPQATVYVASGGGYADALSAAPLAGAQGAPLAPRGADVRAGARSRPSSSASSRRNIVVLGGPGVVSARGLRPSCTALTSTRRWRHTRLRPRPLRHLRGACCATYPTPVSTTPVIYVVAGTDYPDGLSGGGPGRPPGRPAGARAAGRHPAPRADPAAAAQAGQHRRPGRHVGRVGRRPLAARRPHHAGRRRQPHRRGGPLQDVRADLAGRLPQPPARAGRVRRGGDRLRRRPVRARRWRPRTGCPCCWSSRRRCRPPSARS